MGVELIWWDYAWGSGCHCGCICVWLVWVFVVRLLVGIGNVCLVGWLVTWSIGWLVVCRII